MQRKAYVTGTAALLVALLAGCTSGSGDDRPTDDANPGNAGTTTPAAQPGKYRSLPEACRVVDHDALDTLLPGIGQITDQDQREKAYQGEATLTYNTDRTVGCRWKASSGAATDRLAVDFERVVSYDNAVSDDDQAQRLYLDQQAAADLPEPSAPASASPTTPAPTASTDDDASPSAPESPSGAAGAPPAELQPRVLPGLGDEAYLDDKLNTSGSAAEQRTVTVVFRTSNVVVTIEYEEQPMATGTVPDSKELQDRARNLASQLADTLGG
ncbi:DUF3558 domain-containing protein [Streptomyces sp. NPDC059168]|uniref:DUF3558 domain-containing protein n=1 Tax=Streptomyces sp. NPDC059168 TaxID=3346753 RepID=UPI0036926214